MRAGTLNIEISAYTFLSKFKGDNMRTFIRFAFIVVVVGSLIMSGSLGFCAGEPWRSEILKGIKSFTIVVESLKPEIERDGLTKMKIIIDVELKLGLAGINIDDDPLSAILSVNARILKTERRGYVFNICISVDQSVYLHRNNKMMPIIASTWDTESLGITRDLNDIRNTIKELMDKFINDYLSANPKGKTASDKQK